MNLKAKNLMSLKKGNFSSWEVVNRCVRRLARRRWRSWMLHLDSRGLMGVEIVMIGLEEVDVTEEIVVEEEEDVGRMIDVEVEEDEEEDGVVDVEHPLHLTPIPSLLYKSRNE
jgi:hypothetical protein